MRTLPRESIRAVHPGCSQIVAPAIARIAGPGISASIDAASAKQTRMLPEYL